MEIIRGKLLRAQKVVVYGPEGIGKSTFASKFPDPLFIDTEGSTTELDVARTKPPSSWTMLMSQLEYVKQNKPCKTLVIDTGDWAERLCKEHVCAQAQVKSIEAFGYGKGYTILQETWGTLLNKLTEIIEEGIHVLVTAHAQMRKFEQPEETGAYDRWELKLEKKTAALTKEWADMILFANYKILVVNVDNQGAAKGKNKARGGQRIMNTVHNPAWDAKNRQGLAEELKFEFDEISNIFNRPLSSDDISDKAVKNETDLEEVQKETPKEDAKETLITEFKEEEVKEGFIEQKNMDGPAIFNEDIPNQLLDLMKADRVTVEEIKNIVAIKGYFPKDTPIKNYPTEFVDGVLVAAWKQVFKAIVNERVPF